MAIDEFQRGGDDLLLALKASIDRSDTRGQYLLTGSTRFLTTRTLSETLTGRTQRAKQRRVGNVLDTALAAHLLGQTSDDLARPDNPWFGPLLESFVVGELAKQATWAERPVRLAQYRDRDQREVDVVMESGQRVVAVEVKATATPRPTDARHLANLRDRVGERFVTGVVLHTGQQRLALGDPVVAMPVSDLWA